MIRSSAESSFENSFEERQVNKQKGAAVDSINGSFVSLDAALVFELVINNIELTNHPLEQNRSSMS